MDVGKFARITRSTKERRTHETHLRVEVFRSLMVRQIRRDMKMRGQTERKRKGGARKGRAH